jgi:hypothetical protein
VAITALVARRPARVTRACERKDSNRLRSCNFGKKFLPVDAILKLLIRKSFWRERKKSGKKIKSACQ